MLSGEALIAIVNPRERRKMARRTPPRNAKGRFMKRGHSHRARSNPRPRRARRSHARVHTRTRYRARARVHHRRRRAHRNPRFGIPSTRMIGSTMGGALVGASGALALDLALNFGGRYLPPAITQPGWTRNLLRLAGAFLIGALSGVVVKPETRRAITAGAVTVVTYSIVRDLANEYVLPAGMQLGDPDVGGQAYPWGWNPFLARLGHGGSTSSSDGSMMSSYVGGRIRSFNLPRVRAGAGAVAGGGQRRLSSYVDDGVTSPGGSGLGADIEL